MLVESYDVIVDGNHVLFEVAELSSDEEVGRSVFGFTVEQEYFDQQGSARGLAILDLGVLRTAQGLETVSVQTVEEDTQLHH